jgi:hypothetical protein
MAVLKWAFRVSGNTANRRACRFLICGITGAIRSPMDDLDLEVIHPGEMTHFSFSNGHPLMDETVNLDQLPDQLIGFRSEKICQVGHGNGNFNENLVRRFFGRCRGFVEGDFSVRHYATVKGSLPVMGLLQTNGN